MSRDAVLFRFISMGLIIVTFLFFHLGIVEFQKAVVLMLMLVGTISLWGGNNE